MPAHPAPQGREVRTTGLLLNHAAARGLLHESASLDEVQSLAEKGLSLASTPELKALGWYLLADVFSRRHQPENVSRALRNARMHASANARASHEPSSP